MGTTNNPEQEVYDPNVEDKRHEASSQEKLDNKHDNNTTNYECFRCSLSFQKWQALENKVDEDYSTTYCSAECQQKDLEEMANDAYTPD